MTNLEKMKNEPSSNIVPLAGMSRRTFLVTLAGLGTAFIGKFVFKLDRSAAKKKNEFISLKKAEFTSSDDLAG